MVEPANLVDRDSEHLRMLSIFHYVLAGLNALMSCLFILYLVIGIALVIAGAHADEGAPPAIIGGIFIVMGLFALAIGLAVAALLFYAGRFLAQRRHHTYCFVIAILSLLSFPLGTALGVFTLVVLSRPSVKALFGA
jgi:hypothetical protein